MKYTKKPITIEAIQWTGQNLDEVKEFTGHWSMYSQGELFITTHEGCMKATVGDFIIKGIKGEFYPCKPDIFEQSYDLEKVA